MVLSLIVPVYNTAPYLAECLDSMLDQDVSRNEYEIVCVNDGSTDGSLEILRDYEARYPNIVVVDKENGGVATARNAGLDVARGEYIWFFDSDDVMHRNALGRICAAIGQRKLDRLMVGIYIFGAELTRDELAQIAEGSLRVTSRSYDSSVCNNILRREFLLEHGCRFCYPRISHGEDTIFMYETLIHCPWQESLEIPAYLYRTRPGSACTSDSRPSQVRKMNSYMNAALVMQRHWDAGQRDTRTANLLMSYIWYTMHMATQVPGAESRAAVAALKKAGLYPFRRPTECTMAKSYQTTRTDAVGKLFDKVYINMHRPWGFASMKILQTAIGLKHSLGK